MAKVVSEAGGLALTPDSRVDQEAGVIHGAKVLGGVSKNGRRYPAALLAERFAVYEGAQCYADHDYARMKTGHARPLTQWGGVIRNVAFRQDGLYGDVHCLKESAAGRIILEAAVRCPDKFGLSPVHLIEAKKQPDGTEVVTAILECVSVDAVTRPATTRTLFEEEQTMPGTSGPFTVAEAFVHLQNALMASADHDDSERMAALDAVMKVKAYVLEGGEEPALPATAEGQTPAAPTGLRKKVDDLTATIRAMNIRQLAGESLPLDAPTMARLLGMTDEAAAVEIEAMRRARRPRYHPGPPRSQGRAVTESAAAAAPAIPSLLAGADRDAVRRFYRGG